MQLNNSTDYAIRIVLYLAKSQSVVSSKKLAKIINVSPRYLLQINSKLREAGIVSVTYGSNGGIALVRSVSEINLYDIVFLMEGTIRSRQTSVRDQQETEELIFLNAAYEYVEGLLEQSLKSITFESLLSQTEEQWC